MKRFSIEEKIAHHLDFWEGREQKYPLTSIRMGEIFFSREFKALERLVQKGTALTADMLDVDALLPDYERMFQELEQVSMDGMFSADPCTGIPWMEAIFGCPVEATGVSFVSHPVYSALSEIDGLDYSRQNPWYQKYLEFCVKLTRLADGRFPVGQPILRGVTDVVGSLIGQQNMVLGFFEDEDIMRAAFDTVVRAQRDLIEDHYRVTEPFHGGHNFGFYHVWAPGKVMWFQEDLAALLSPSHFDDYLRKTYNDYIRGYDYSLVHLHPTAFFHLDGICSVEDLTAVQITCDAGGPTMEELIPYCLKVLESGKRLLLGLSRLTKDDIDVVKRRLPRCGVALTILADDQAQAQDILDHIQKA